MVLVLATSTWLGLLTTLGVVAAFGFGARAARGTVEAAEALEPAAV